MAIVKKIIDEFDSSDELAQVQRELVEGLAKYAQSKADIFEIEIRESLRTAGKDDNKTIPVTSIVAAQTFVRAYTSKSGADIANIVNESLAAFVQGTSESVLSGVGKLITKGLSVFLGESSASTGEESQYYVMTEGIAIVRVDTRAWYLNVSSKSVFEKMERVVAFVGVKSTVDLKSIDFNTFLYLYQRQLILAGLDQQQLVKALTEAKEIYDLYNKLAGTPKTVTFDFGGAPARVKAKRLK